MAGSPYQDPFRELESLRSEREAIAENTTREATSYQMIESTGWGEIKFPECLEFDCTFIEKPWMSYGPALDGSKLVPTRFPRCTAGVYEWKTTPQGHYVGAWVFVVVDVRSPYIPTTAETPAYAIEHYFTFKGLAIKALPDYLLEDL